ncbi:CHASE domain-containing protein [Nitrospirillum sp. BR 11163]|uniref:CHASE domain-containing protein n=1 Tax=Nitrospirillum sp. BR 11163 TaxID=3104323 RepID=UPI002AFEAB16|nr:CHASE domain-containing protein [Nitrospirillum sp. BR 11163]MEA1675112.1 CHASE domain-containing protein [Nitrospirillum sp. BR 11163]
MRPFPGYALATSLKILVLAAAYLGTARLGLALASLSDSASPVWPASGLAVAGLLIFGMGTWPFVLIGAFIANLLTPGVGLLTAAFIALGNTGEAMLGALLFARIDGIEKERLQISRAAAHGLAAIVAPVCSATIGISALLVAGNLSWNVNLGAIWVTWWTGDALGILIITTLLVALREAKAADYRPSRLWATLFSDLLPVLGLTAAALVLPFLPVARTLLGPAAALGIFLLYPAILLAARRYGPAAAHLVVLAAAVAYVLGTAAGLGPFMDATLNQSLLNMQAMLATFALTAIVFSDIPHQSARLGSTVFLVGCLVATGVFMDRTDIARARDEAHLGKIVDSAMARIHERLLVYSNALESGAALYATGLPVGRAQWRAFAGTINIDGRYPGINGIGVIYPVAPDGLEAFLARVRADGAPDFKLHAASTEPVLDDFADALEYDVITYIEPAGVNAPALGLNVATEANRRDAAFRARDTGLPAMTKRIILVQDAQRRAGFLYFIPVYMPGKPLDTVAQRRQALRCWIYAPFISEVFFREALRDMVEEVNVAVYDGGEVRPDALLYRKISPDTLGGRLAARLGLKAAGLGMAEQVSRVDEGGTP